MSWTSSLQNNEQAETVLRWVVDNCKERHLIPRETSWIWPKSSNLRGYALGSVMYLQDSRAAEHMPNFRAYDAEDLYLLYEFVVFEAIVVRGLQKRGATAAMAGTIGAAIGTKVMKGIPSMVAGGAGVSGVGGDLGMSAFDSVVGGLSDTMLGDGRTGSFAVAGKTFHKATQLSQQNPDRGYIQIDPAPMDTTHRMRRLGGWTGNTEPVHRDGNDKNRGFMAQHRLLVSQVTPLWYGARMDVVKCWHRSGLSVSRFERRAICDSFFEMVSKRGDEQASAALSRVAFEGVGDVHNQVIRSDAKTFTSATRAAGWFDVADPATSLNDPFSNPQWSQWDDPPEAFAKSLR